jgi:DNA-binding beta-propeller fold protein YncE
MSLCLVSILGFMILLNATNISQNSVAMPGQESYQFVRSWGGQGSNDGQFLLPHSLAVDTSGNIYVTDTGNNRVEKFSPNGTFISKWGSRGTGMDNLFGYMISMSVQMANLFTPLN